MEKAAFICSLARTDTLVMLTSSGRIYQFTQPSAAPQPTAGPPVSGGTWVEIPLPEDFKSEISEKVDTLGRMPQGYALYKRNDNNLFFWQQEGAMPLTEVPLMAGESTASEQFERMEGAIASARNDYMIKHRPRKAPRPEEPL